MAEGDPALRQVVRGEFEGDFVACQNANPVTAEASGQMGQHNFFMIELHAEESAGKFLQHGSGYFNAVFFTHSTSYLEQSGYLRKKADGPRRAIRFRSLADGDVFGLQAFGTLLDHK